MLLISKLFAPVPLEERLYRMGWHRDGNIWSWGDGSTQFSSAQRAYDWYTEKVRVGAEISRHL